MKKNMGTIDRAIRTIIALFIGYLYFSDILKGTTGIILLIVAIVFLLTSLISFCPLYTIFGLKICPTKTEK